MRLFVLLVLIFIIAGCQQADVLKNNIMYKSLEASNQSLSESTEEIDKYLREQYAALPDCYSESISKLDKVDDEIRNFRDLSTIEDQRKTIPNLIKFFETIDKGQEHHFLCQEGEYEDEVFKVLLESDLIINKHRIYNSLFVEDGCKGNEEWPY